MNLTVANILTVARLFLAPVFLLFMLGSSEESISWAWIIFTIAALTDYFDGLVARKYGQVTSQGEFLDPLADKILTMAAFVSFYMIDVMPLWMVIVIVIRDFGTTALRSLATDKGTVMRTSWPAKIKTFLQMLFIVYVLALVWAMRVVPDTRLGSLAMNLVASPIMYYCALGLTLYTLWTLVDYIIQNRKLFVRGTAN